MDGIFGIGPLELILIAVLALIVLGPERLPGVMREGAKYIRQLRRLGNELTSNFSEELAALDEINPRRIFSEITNPDQPQADANPAAKPAAAKPPAPKPATSAQPQANGTIASTPPARPSTPAAQISSAKAIAKASGMPVAPAAPEPATEVPAVPVAAAPSADHESPTTLEERGQFTDNSILPPGRVDAQTLSNEVSPSGTEPGAHDGNGHPSEPPESPA